MPKKAIILFFVTILTLKDNKTKNQNSSETPKILELLKHLLPKAIQKDEKTITWKKDINWEKRFFNLKSAQDVTLRYFDLLLDTYSSEIMNSCIKIFKNDWELKEKILTEKMENLINYFNLKKEEPNFKKNEEYKQNKKLYKEYGGELQKAFSEFQIFTGFCYNYFLYIKNFSFLTKFFFDSKFNLVYFKMHLADQKIENIDAFKFFIFKLSEVVEEGTFENVDNDHQEIFYIIYNHFVGDLELKRKIQKL